MITIEELKVIRDKTRKEIELRLQGKKDEKKSDDKK